MLRRPTVLSGLVVTACLALSGCSTDGDRTPAAPPVVPSVASSEPTAVPDPPSPAPTTPASSSPPASPSPGPGDPLAPQPGKESAPPPGLPTCKAASLTVVDADTLVYPQYVHEVFAVRTSGPDCQLKGHPVVRLLRADGSALPVQVGRGGLGLPSEPVSVVTLSRATSLSFLVATPRDGGCEDAATLEAQLPGTSPAKRTPTTLRVCAGKAATSAVRRSTDDE